MTLWQDYERYSRRRNRAAAQSVSDVVRKALERYVKAGRRKQAQRGGE